MTKLQNIWQQLQTITENNFFSGVSCKWFGNFSYTAFVGANISNTDENSTTEVLELLFTNLIWT